MKQVYIDKKPLISVMMPCHNGANYLESTINSIQNQTYTNWELIFVDDGSTDHTLAIIQKLADKDDRIRVYTMPHGGRGHARNACLEHVRGEFIAICDADDISFPERFEKQIKYLLLNKEIDVVGSWWIPFSSQLPIRSEPVRKSPTSPIAFRESFRRGKMRIHNATTMLRSHLFRQYGGYDVEQKRAQDYEFFARVSKAGVQFSALAEPLIFYRQEAEIVSCKYFLESNMYIAYANANRLEKFENFKSFSFSLNGRMWSAYFAVKYVYFCLKMSCMKLVGR